VGGPRAWIARPSADVIDALARQMARRGSLQRLDAIARLASRLSPRLRDYRTARALAVSGNIAGRRAFALRVTGGRVSYENLIVALDNYRDPNRWAEATVALRHVSPKRGELLAWVMLNQGTEHEDAARALALLEWLRERGGERSLSRMGREAYLELLIVTGQRERVRAALPPVAGATPFERRCWADAINPFVDTVPGSLSPWLSVVGDPYRAAGIEAPLISAAEGQSPFARLHTDAVTAIDTPERITVVVSSYQPDERLLVAVQSVVLSSWANLEVLVFDDASGPEFTHWYDQAEAIDPRVTVHRMPVNGGTYRIRNRALDIATGDFLTFHDSDDWMHPRRLELQVQHLREHPNLPANTTLSVRVTGNLEFINSRSLGPKLCEPAILLRRTAVRERVGYFDSLRKAADAEFRLRVQAAWNVEVPTIGSIPLTWQLVASDSLSDSDIRRYWIHLERRIHRSCYEAWHRDCVRQGHVPSIALDHPDDRRPYYAPPLVMGAAGASSEPRPSFDVVIAANWLDGSLSRNSERRRLALIHELGDRGLHVAITHLDRLWSGDSMRLSLSLPAVRALNQGAMEYISVNAPALTRVLVTSGDGPIPERPDTLDALTFDHAIPDEGAAAGLEPAAFAALVHARVSGNGSKP
jgi:glycosyltransferase involved in cell wall biosynthesis